MPYKRKRNPEQFTTDEAQTATLIVTEGGYGCKRPHKTYAYPTIDIRMCDRQALEPAERVFGTKIHPVRSHKRHCPDQLFPPPKRERNMAGRSHGENCRKGHTKTQTPPNRMEHHKMARNH